MPRSFLLTCVLFCSFSFLSTFQPASSFLVEFLIKEKVSPTSPSTNTLQNITQVQVYEDVFPIWSYSYCAALLLMGILAETIGHKIMILLGFGAGVASLGILIWSNSFQLIQFQEVLSGMYFAGIQALLHAVLTLVAYILFSAYSFNVTKSQDYQKIISFIRGSYLIGTVASALLGTAPNTDRIFT